MTNFRRNCSNQIGPRSNGPPNHNMYSTYIRCSNSMLVASCFGAYIKHRHACGPVIQCPKIAKDSGHEAPYVQKLVALQPIYTSMIKVNSNDAVQVPNSQ